MSILPPKRLSASTGLNVLDLGSANPQKITLVKLILKQADATEASLWDAIQKLPEKQRMSRADFEEALRELVASKWLWKNGSGETATYTPRLQKKVSRVRLYAQMNANTTTSASAFTTMWNLLDQRAAQGDDDTTAPPVQGAVAAKISGWLSGLAGAQQVLILLVGTLAVFAFASSSLNVIGSSGFLGSLGPQRMPWLWIIETTLYLLSSTIYIRFADRIPRVRLLKGLLSGLVVTYLLALALFLASTYFKFFADLAIMLKQDKPQALVYPLIYLINAQQCILFPMAFWNLANSLYSSMSEARKVFPLIATGSTVGGLIGSMLFTKLIAGQALLSSDQAPLLLGLNAGLLVLLLVFAGAILKENDRDDNETQGEGYNLLGQIRAGLETIREIPLFRYLGLVILLSRVAFCFLIYHTLFSMNAFSNSQAKGSLENLFSWLGIAGTLLPLLLQWRVVPFFTNKVDTKNSFIALPAMQALALVVVLLMPKSLFATMIVLLLCFSIASSWDSPVLNTLQNLIPEERRAQINTLLTQYSFVVGQITGCVLLLIIFAVAPFFKVETSSFYLPLGLLASLGAILSAISVSHTYTNSMLSWRVARRQRSSSVLDKLDF